MKSTSEYLNMQIPGYLKLLPTCEDLCLETLAFPVNLP